MHWYGVFNAAGPRKVHMEDTVHIEIKKDVEYLSHIELDIESEIGEELWICMLTQHNNWGEYMIVESDKYNCIKVFTQDIYDECYNYIYVDGWFDKYMGKYDEDDESEIEFEYLRDNNFEMFTSEEAFKTYILEHNYIELIGAAVILQKIIVV